MDWDGGTCVIVHGQANCPSLSVADCISKTSFSGERLLDWEPVALSFCPGSVLGLYDFKKVPFLGFHFIRILDLRTLREFYLSSNYSTPVPSFGEEEHEARTFK